MELAEAFHICADFFMDRVFYRHGIIVASMYVIKITISDRKHILEKESGFYSIKCAENDRQAASILEYIKIDRDKSTFKSHRDFDSEIEMTFKHF